MLKGPDIVSSETEGVWISSGFEGEGFGGVSDSGEYCEGIAVDSEVEVSSGSEGIDSLKRIPQ
jgi:hypothetical protein